ncbi:hypothetical protein NUH87_06590 [Pseudomonas batumici]|uniref:hypothetical protein n=1 Tax=Pseudomonas batumici TaxID=226910 RepID=UPI0030D2318A
MKTVGLVRRLEGVETRGCDHVIVEGEDIALAKQRLQGLNVRLGLDVLGGAYAGRLLQVLSPKGKLVVYGAVTLQPMEISGGVLIAGELTIESFKVAVSPKYLRRYGHFAWTQNAKHEQPKAPQKPWKSLTGTFDIRARS